MSQTIAPETLARDAARVAYDIAARAAGHKRYVIYRAADFDDVRAAARAAIEAYAEVRAPHQIVEFVVEHDEHGTAIELDVAIPEGHGHLAAVITIKSAVALDESDRLEIAEHIALRLIALDREVRAYLTSVIHIFEEPTQQTE